MSDYKNRTIEEALFNAERIKKEYPRYIQPDVSDKDMVLMLEQIQTLTEALAEFKKAKIKELIEEYDKGEEWEPPHVIFQMAEDVDSLTEALAAKEKELSECQKERDELRKANTILLESNTWYVLKRNGEHDGLGMRICTDDKGKIIMADMKAPSFPIAFITQQNR